MMVYNNPDMPIRVKLNQTFTISLESNPTTGFTWEAEYDSELIELIKRGDIILRSSAMGAGGKEPFEFQAKKIGETQIKMKYKRNWEPSPQKVEIYRVYISQ